MEDIQKHSLKNIKDARKWAGPDAAAQIPALLKQYFGDKSTTLFHSVGEEKLIPAIIRDGMLLSNDTLRKKFGKVIGGHTITKDRVHPVFDTISLREDVYRDRVYFRLQFDSPKPEKLHEAEDGIYLNFDDIPKTAWFNFKDPGFIGKEEIDEGIWHNSTFGGFHYDDVYSGKHIKEAILFKALKVLNQAVAMTKKEKIIPRDMFDKARLLVHPVTPFETMDEALEAMEGYPENARSAFAHHRINRLAPLARDYLESEDFPRHFEKALGFVLEDVARDGQITLPDNVDITNATLKHGGRIQTVTEWRSDMPARKVSQPTPAIP